MTLFFTSDSKSTGTGFLLVSFLKKIGLNGYLLFHTAIWNKGSYCKRSFAIQYKPMSWEPKYVNWKKFAPNVWHWAEHQNGKYQIFRYDVI